MIPHREPGNEFFGNRFKQRVTACRKRLRINRHLYRVHSSDEPSALTQENTSFPPGYPAVRESLIGEGNVSEFRDDWVRLEKEVVIT